MDWSAILVAIISAISVIIVAVVNRNANNENREKTDSQYKIIVNKLDDLTLRIVRLDLLNAIQHDPENVAVIMSMAKLYFVELHGNCYMGKVFQEWANKHDINVGNLLGKEEK